MGSDLRLYESPSHRRGGCFAFAATVLLLHADPSRGGGGLPDRLRAFAGATPCFWMILPGEKYLLQRASRSKTSTFARSVGTRVCRKVACTYLSGDVWFLPCRCGVRPRFASIRSARKVSNFRNKMTMTF